jgi:hypothetical protein
MGLESRQLGDGMRMESVSVIYLGRIEGKDGIVTLVPHSYFSIEYPIRSGS